MARESEVDVREVNEHGDGGPLAADRADEAAITGVDVRDMAEDLGRAHDGDVLGADHLLLMLTGHLSAAQPGEGRVGNAGAKGADELCAIGVAGCFACGKEDARIGDGSDESSLSLSEMRARR
jgi:hypothetical protein